MKEYIKPELYIDYYASDTMIASSNLGNPKNGNAGNNQNCWGCNSTAGMIDGNNACAIIEGTPAYDVFC